MPFIGKVNQANLGKADRIVTIGLRIVQEFINGGEVGIAGAVIVIIGSNHLVTEPQGMA